MIFCKAECNFTPNGWLGILVGAKLWYNFYDANELPKSVDKVSKELESSTARSGAPKAKSTAAARVATAASAPGPGLSSPPQTPRDHGVALAGWPSTGPSEYAERTDDWAKLLTARRFLCFLKALSDHCLIRPIVTRAHAPRQAIDELESALPPLLRPEEARRLRRACMARDHGAAHALPMLVRADGMLAGQVGRSTSSHCPVAHSLQPLRRGSH